MGPFGVMTLMIDQMPRTSALYGGFHEVLGLTSSHAIHALLLQQILDPAKLRCSIYECHA